MELRSKKRLYFGTNEKENMYLLDELALKKAKECYIYPDDLLNEFDCISIDPFDKPKKEWHGKYFMKCNYDYENYLLKYCYFCNCYMILGTAENGCYTENSETIIITDEPSNLHCFRTTCDRFTSQNFCKFCERENG